MMTKCDTIDAIKKLNPTANSGFLAEFTGDDLSAYLVRLNNRPRTTPIAQADDDPSTRARTQPNADAQELFDR